MEKHILTLKGRLWHPLPVAYDRRFWEGIDCFNAHDFYAAHDAWEDLWLGLAPGEDKDFLQGLILCAVALHHYGNRNFRGGRSRFRLAESMLEKVASPFWGIDVKHFLRRMNGTLYRLLTEEEPPELNRKTIPKLTLIKKDEE